MNWATTNFVVVCSIMNSILPSPSHRFSINWLIQQSTWLDFLFFLLERIQTMESQTLRKSFLPHDVLKNDNIQIVCCFQLKQLSMYAFNGVFDSIPLLGVFACALMHDGVSWQSHTHTHWLNVAIAHCFCCLLHLFSSNSFKTNYSIIYKAAIHTNISTMEITILIDFLS